MSRFALYGPRPTWTRSQSNQAETVHIHPRRRTERLVRLRDLRHYACRHALRDDNATAWHKPRDAPSILLIAGKRLREQSLFVPALGEKEGGARDGQS